MKSREEITGWAKAWADAFSDAECIDISDVDAGDTVIVTFTGQGTNDGPLGPLPATGQRATLPFCQIFHFDDQGTCDSWEAYYDQLSLLIQLGHAQAPPSS